MEIEIGLRDGLGPEPAVRRRRGVVGTDLAVDDDVRDVNAARAELPRHALRHRAQGELRRCEVGEVRSAPQ